MTRLPISALTLALITCWTAPPAGAQSIDDALALYEDDDYEEAAFAFYDVLQHDKSAEVRDQAEIYLAESLRKLHFYFPALFYYSDLLQAGDSSRYYLKSVQGLLEMQEELHDPLFVPTLINAKFDPQNFGKLPQDKIAQINYLIGELSARKRKDDDARAFLQFVPASSQHYAKARYVLGILDVRAGRSEAALKRFEEVLEAVASDAPSESRRRVRNLALLALGRASFGTGNFQTASGYYKRVPRFDGEWFEALFENAWAHFRAGDYGSALGELQSVTSPYFAKRHIPEVYVVQGTAYFANCQWDRVRSAVATYKKLYGPMSAGLDAYLKDGRDPVGYYRDVVASGTGRFSAEIARQVRRTTRFKDYHFMIEHLAWEREAVSRVGVWKNSRLQQDAQSVIDQHRQELETVVGRWVHVQLRNLHAQLEHFSSQIEILDFEVADAERQWLEQGKEILKGRRARLPRPDIPNDQWQHWKFADEYWKDELGYYRHTVRSECE